MDCDEVPDTFMMIFKTKKSTNSHHQKAFQYRFTQTIVFH